MSGRRSFWLVAIAGVLVAAGGAWLGWRRLHRRPVASPLTLTLQIESRRRVEVLPGTPIIFDVYLAAPKGAPAAELGRAGRPWRSQLRLIDDRSHKPLSWATVVLDSRPGGSPKVADMAVVDFDHIQHIVLATSPETMRAVAPGTYGVRAALEASSQRGGVESPSVTVVVREAGATLDRDRLERDRVVSSAEFYLETKRFEEARRLVEDLVSREPRNPGAWMRLGDALDGLGKPREALNVYRRALAVSPRTYEEPTLLYERMGAMRRKLTS